MFCGKGSEEKETEATILETIAKVAAENPGNRAMKYFKKEDFDKLADDKKAIFIKCIRTGFENPTSGLGCYAMAPNDYKNFDWFFDPVIRDYHSAAADAVHKTNWDASNVGEGGVLDVTKLGLAELSMRVRVGRNLAAFNLPGNMDQAERIKFEKTMHEAFKKLIADPAYGGTVYSLTPDFGNDEKNPNLITPEKYQQLVDAHVMFKDMDADPFLKSAGIASDWPYGRGCWQSEDKQCIIWFGEEDQLRIMCMKKGTKLNEVFDRLKTLLDAVESIDGIDFARSDKYGYVTSCPSNLGTGMRASVHMKIPNLTSDGTVDISPQARLFIKEAEIIEALYKGIEALMAK